MKNKWKCMFIKNYSPSGNERVFYLLPRKKFKKIYWLFWVWIKIT